MSRMAFNLGRPALFAGEETIRHCREFLNHPLGVANDSRLVASCELLTARRECPLPDGLSSLHALALLCLALVLSKSLNPARDPFLRCR